MATLLAKVREGPCPKPPSTRMMALVSESVSDHRARALKVATWLVDKERPDEAVAVLAVWAASGPNDAEGQNLLAEALRIDPGAHLAQEAFEKMEGTGTALTRLDRALGDFDLKFLQKVEAEMRKPSFRRAQMGFNNNVKFRNTVFHVQTEDSGLDAPHIITHLFADGGRIIKSHKRGYEAEVHRPDIGEFVRGLMKAQHLEMVMKLREGAFDRVIAGQEMGGIDVLTEPPNVDKLKKKKKEEVAESEIVAASIRSAQVVFRLHVLRTLSGGPDTYAPTGNRAIIGSKGAISLSGDKFCHPEEALLVMRGGQLFLDDLEGGNGIFVRIRGAVELELGDEFVVGDQLLTVQKNPKPDDGPAPDPTYFYSSPKWPSSFRVVQMFEGGAPGSTALARGKALQIGASVGDMIFPEDPLISEQHCLVEDQAGSIVLTDLGSRTGVFVRVHGEHVLQNGDELLVGRTRLLVDIPGQAS
jgi:pSer/pThr/pTyr-binding forkhead associated (FHA) protein